MKKIIVLGMAWLILLCCVPALAAVPSAPTGEYFPSEKTLTEEELAQRNAAYHEILTLSETDGHIIAVRLSSGGEWVFLELDAPPETIKEYAKRFSQYASFLIFTDDIEKAMTEGTINELGFITGSGIQTLTFRDGIWNIWIIGGLAVLVLGAAFLLLSRKGLLPVLQTSNGETVAENGAVHRREIVSAVKKSEQIPSETLFQSILQKIDKH